MHFYEKRTLEKISSTLKKNLHGDLIAIYAFGSRVRGDHREGSDFDILVIVKNRTLKIEETIIDVFVEEEMESGLSFDPLIKTASSFELEKQHHTPFYQNIQNEGIPV